MRLYFVRHGESTANLRNEFSNRNQEQHPLTENGRAQVQAVAEKLKDVPFAAIYTSPYLRARQTAEILNAPHGAPFYLESALQEHDPGELDGRGDPAAWKQYSDLIQGWLTTGNGDARIPGGESFSDLQARFNPFLKRLLDRYGDTSANLLLVGHAGVFHLMLPGALSNVSYAFTTQHILDNAGLIVVAREDGALVCESWNGLALDAQGRVVE